MTFTRWQPPPSHRLARLGEGDETESFAIGVDGTRLYVRRRPGPSLTSPDGGGPKVTPTTKAGGLEGGTVSAPTVLLCDGVLCDGFIWKYLWDDLAAIGPVAHWHYRGHGRSGAPRDPDRVEITDFAQDLDAVRRHLGDPPVVLMGHSMGVQVALEAYRFRREGIAGLVLCCGAPGKVTETFHGTNYLARALPNVLAFVTKHSEIARALWSRVPAELALKLSFFMKEVDVEHMQREDLLPYLKHMTHVDFGLFVRLLRAAGEHSAEDLLPEIRVPALVIAAERDTFTPPELAKRMADAMPMGQHLLLENGSHAALIEQPDLVRVRIKRFLEDVDKFLSHSTTLAEPGVARPLASKPKASGASSG